ncbi:hypothetical protein HNP32_001975 [Brevundimonas bullata]|uniref:Uncharacterized protein n=1 Tax=Brevundimonas bullata TaxID=13160 RepID=A0A7W7IPM9_9CAUL|nr:hypothetical protein [Brevundimonas bullata]MBB4798231.1 hypothetical protein [Brevundimonas bullata]MBB6383455.1 hypothetical protein [Brevundimonas bullata]
MSSRFFLVIQRDKVVGYALDRTEITPVSATADLEVGQSQTEKRRRF